jgi:hypothetical protein
VLALAVLEVAVLTMTPGSDVFSRFGHTAILVEDDQGIRVFNFGAFKGDDPHIFSQFLHNAIPYYLTKNDSQLFFYKYRNRRVLAQVLDLDESEARHLIEKLEWTARPENRNYKYDWFHNNCTTKTRDAIDEALGGILQEQFAGKPPRGHPTIRKLMMDALWSAPSIGTLFSISMNDRAEEPLDSWSELAMPIDLMRGLREAKRSDGRPLVADEWTWDGPAPRPRNQATFIQPLCEALLLFLLMMGVLFRVRVGLYVWSLFCLILSAWFVFWSIIPYGYGFLTMNLLGYSPLMIFVLLRHRWARRILEIIILSTIFGLIFARQVHLRYALYSLAANSLCWLQLRAEAVGRRALRSA